MNTWIGVALIVLYCIVFGPGCIGLSTHLIPPLCDDSPPQTPAAACQSAHRCRHGQVQNIAGRAKDSETPLLDQSSKAGTLDSTPN